MKTPRNAQQTIEALAELFPQLFVAEAWQNHKPLKIGITHDLLARGVIQPEERWVLKVYTNRRMYLVTLAAGGHRYDLDGAVGGEITAEHAAIAASQVADIDTRRVTKAAAVRTMLARNSRRSKPPAPEASPQRLSLAGLKAAAQARKLANAGAAP